MPVAKLNRLKMLHRIVPPMLITLGLLWLLQGALARTGNHGVIIRNLNYDAGTVKAGSTVTDTVRLINLSSQPVEVDAQPGCGCTVVYQPIASINPFHSQTVKAEVNVEGGGPATQEKAVLLQMRSQAKTWQQVALINFRIK